MGNSDKPEGAARDAQDRILSALSKRALTRKHGALPPASDLDDELLCRYVDGGLTDGERQALERRLTIDLDAKERVATLVAALSDAGVARPAVPEPVTQTIARHVFHVAGSLMELLRGGEGVQQMVHAATRGTEAVRPTSFQIDRLFQTAQGTLSARFELHAERADSAEEAGQNPLVDLVVHVGTDGKPVEGVRCKLLRDGRPVDSREVEAVGCTFTRLGPARYDVELRKGGVEIGRVLFDLRG